MKRNILIVISLILAGVLLLEMGYIVHMGISASKQGEPSNPVGDTQGTAGQESTAGSEQTSPQNTESTQTTTNGIVDIPLETPEDSVPVDTKPVGTEPVETKPGQTTEPTTGNNSDVTEPTIELEENELPIVTFG